MLYNITKNNVPEYLRNSIPPTVQSVIVYALHNGNDIMLPFCRLALTNESFLTSTIRLWNIFDTPIGQADAIGKFKTKLNNLNLNSYKYRRNITS